MVEDEVCQDHIELPILKWEGGQGSYAEVHSRDKTRSHRDHVRDRTRAYPGEALTVIHGLADPVTPLLGVEIRDLHATHDPPASCRFHALTRLWTKLAGGRDSNVGCEIRS